MKKLDSNLQKQQQSWPKISNTARKYNKDENLENYDSEVQMHARAHSGPWLANYNHLRLSARNCARTKLRGESRNILHAIFFMFILLISNHTVFLVQFGINLHLWVFHSCKLIPNWTRNRMITYTNWAMNNPLAWALALVLPRFLLARFGSSPTQIPRAWNRLPFSRASTQVSGF